MSETADPRPRPWGVFRIGRETAWCFTIEHAKNYAEKAYPVGLVEIENRDSGEQWKRRGGVWELTRPGSDRLALAGGSAA